MKTFSQVVLSRIVAPAIEYWYPFFGSAHVVGEPVALEPFSYLETPKPEGTRIISV